MRTKCIIFGEALKVRGHKYDKLFLKIVQNTLKWPLQNANFQKFSGGACPRIPLESFLVLKLFEINSAEKTLLKSDENWCPFPEKISEYAPDMKTFSKALFTPASRSKRLCI